MISTDAKYKEVDVYRITGFSDILASPVFYIVLVLTIFLGLSSIFGFLQNPRKLKAVIDVIHHKTVISQNYTTDKKYSLMSVIKNENLEVGSSSTVSYLDESRYSIFSDDFYLDFNAIATDGIQHVSFNYDITSKQFWGDLEMGRILPTVEGTTESLLPLILGVPIDSSLLLDDDSKYSIKGIKKYQI